MGKRTDSSVWTADKGQPPREPDDASATPTPKTKPTPKPKPKPTGDTVWTEKSGIPVPQEPEGAMAKGGTASSRADGIAQRGKTRGTLVMCGGGMYKK